MTDFDLRVLVCCMCLTRRPSFINTKGRADPPLSTENCGGSSATALPAADLHRQFFAAVAASTTAEAVLEAGDVEKDTKEEALNEVVTALARIQGRGCRSAFCCRRARMRKRMASLFRPRSAELAVAIAYCLVGGGRGGPGGLPRGGPEEEKKDIRVLTR